MAEHQHPMMNVDESGNLWLNFGEYGQEVELACFSKDGSRLERQADCEEVWGEESIMSVQINKLHITK